MSSIERSLSAIPADARAAVAAGKRKFIETVWNESGSLSDAFDNFGRSLENRVEAASIGPDGVNVLKLLAFLYECS